MAPSKSSSLKNPYETRSLDYQYYAEFHRASFIKGKRDCVPQLKMPSIYYIAQLVLDNNYSQQDLIYYFIFLESRGFNVRKHSFKSSFFLTKFPELINKENMTILELVEILEQKKLYKFLKGATCYSFESDVLTPIFS